MNLTVSPTEFSYLNLNQRNAGMARVPVFGIANSGKLKNLFEYGLPCMYTGVEMIDPRRVQRFINKNAFSEPVSQTLLFMKPFEKSITGIESKVYKIVQNFAKLHPDKDFQQLLKIMAPHFKPKLKSEQMPILEQISEDAQELPEEYKYKLQHLIAETEDKINERPVCIPFSSFEFKYKLDKICADIAPNNSSKANRVMNRLVLEASRLTDDTDLWTLETQKSILKFLKIILKSSVLKKNEQLKELINDGQKRLNDESFLIPFNRKSFLYDLKNVINSVSDEGLKERLINHALKMPSSKDSISAYILKASREPSWKIGYKFLWPNLASVEHILPQSKGGKDEMSNFGGAGARANALRGNIDFIEQIERVPSTVRNSQKYVNALTQLVKRGVFVKENVSTYYIDDFCNTVKEQSQGKIILDNTEIQQHRIKGSMLMNILAKLRQEN